MGQSMLILGSFSMLSLMALSINQTLLSTQTIGLEMEANLTALSIGQTLMDEITTQEFDERTTTGVKIYSTSEMTPIANMGPDAGETSITWVDSVYYDLAGTTAPYDNGGILCDFKSKAYFDDVDDYNGYRSKVYDYRMGYFDINVVIQYVNEDNPDSVSAVRTNQKRISVSVTQFNLSKNQAGVALPVMLTDLAVYRKFFQ